MRTSTRLLLLLVSFVSTAAAADYEAELLQILEEQTRIATRTRVNVDYVPGILTVLRRSEMHALGVRTVAEALQLVPAVNVQRDETGTPTPLIRGMGQVYSSGNIKFMLNGVPMNNQLNAYALPLLDLPTEQVERIEVMRGPGSAVHGEYAYLGTVNVVTRDGGSNVGLRSGSHGSALWGQVSLAPADGPLRATLSLSQRRVDDSSTAGPDLLGSMGEAALSNAPGPSNGPRGYDALRLDVQGGGFRLQAGDMKSRKGDFFGINWQLPPANQRLVDTEGSRFLEARYGWQAAPELELEVLAGLAHNRRDRDGLFLDPGGVYTPPGEDVFMDNHYREKNAYASFSATWQALAGHQLTAMVRHQRSEVSEGSWRANGFDLPPNWIEPGTSRDLTSLALQDEWQVHRDVTLTLGLRHDEYSDVGTRTTPRLAAVWRLDQTDIIKFQYGEAFRPPTFYELRYGYFGGADGKVIGPETNRTTELGYIRNHGQGTLRLTAYDTKLSDLVVFSSDDGYTNTDGARLRGLEAEASLVLSPEWRLLANLAVGRATGKADNARLPEGTDSTGNLALIWNARPDLTLGAWLHAVGSRHREEDDPRGALYGWRRLNLSAAWQPAAAPGLELRAGVVNLLDDDIRDPSPPTGYLADLSRPGRQWWLEVSHAW